jgi:hypothetical protein
MPRWFIAILLAIVLVAEIAFTAPRLYLAAGVTTLAGYRFSSGLRNRRKTWSVWPRIWGSKTIDM